MKRTRSEPTVIRAYREDDEDQVLRLLKASLGEGPAGNRTPEFFAWKHVHNPFGRSFMLVAEDDERIVGLRAFMRWTFAVGDRLVPAVRAVDTATHPDYQGRGIFSRLTLKALEDLKQEADFVFNTPNAKSKPGYIKMGWRVVGSLPIGVRVRRPLRFASGLRSIRRLPAPRRGKPQVEAARAAEVLADDEAIADLLDTLESVPGRFASARSPQTLMWRYGHAPQLDYRVVGNSRRGLAIFRVRPRGGLWESTVAEMLIPDGDPKVTRELLREVGRSAATDHLTSLLPNGAPKLELIRSGFVRSPLRMTLTTRPLRSTETDPLDMNSWALTLGDVEVF